VNGRVAAEEKLLLKRRRATGGASWGKAEIAKLRKRGIRREGGKLGWDYRKDAHFI